MPKFIVKFQDVSLRPEQLVDADSFNLLDTTATLYRNNVAVFGFTRVASVELVQLTLADQMATIDTQGQQAARPCESADLKNPT